VIIPAAMPGFVSTEFAQQLFVERMRAHRDDEPHEERHPEGLDRAPEGVHRHGKENQEGVAVQACSLELHRRYQ
jgi:hypothetical protein